MTRHDQPPAAAHPVDRWGVQLTWTDAYGQVRDTPEQTLRTLRAAIGEPPADLEHTAPVVARPGGRLSLPVGERVVEVVCEDGTLRSLGAVGADAGEVLPGDFPLGYHRMRMASGVERRLIVSPGRCWLPDGWRAWGLTVQVYATMSNASRRWGVGDLGDLAVLRDWAQRSGAGFVQTSPLHAVAPTLPQEDSPYLPATRRFRNPVYVDVSAVPGGADLADGALEAEGPADGRVDRNRAWRAKRDVLWRVFDKAEELAEYHIWRDAQGQPLHRFATWCALAEQYGPDWRDWPAPLRDPGGTAVADFGSEHRRRVDFFGWLQWLLDRQLRAATGDLPVIQDLPIGVAAGGADAWDWQDVLASGAAVGAPPDVFNSAGQEWGSPPLVPWRLRAADYEPFIASVRATMAGAGGIRIDHVMGLFRLWWVPQGSSPADGAYVRYPSADLLDIVALESHRQRAIVVGEDLGTVEPGVREALGEHAMLGYRLLWFEDDDPADWAGCALAAVTTHDLPTIAGLWTGSDVREQARLTGAAHQDLAEGRSQMLARLNRSGVAAGASVPDVVRAAHRWLGRAPSVLVAATLEDAVGQARRPNLPGADRDNWRIPLPVPVDELPEHPLVQAVVAELSAVVSRSG